MLGQRWRKVKEMKGDDDDNSGEWGPMEMMKSSVYMYGKHVLKCEGNIYIIGSCGEDDERRHNGISKCENDFQCLFTQKITNICAHFSSYFV